MKIKKAIAASVAAVMTLTGGAAALTGCNTCDHVYRKTVITAATCMDTGLAEYVCGICGDKYTEVIPVDPNAHVYGEWDITVQPTYSSTGTAVKTCTLNDNHSVSVSLPALPEDGGAGEYDDVRVTKSPTALSEGVLTYTLAHEAGDVSVNVAIPARGVETVADGVEAALESKPLVREGTGEWGYERRGTQWGGTAEVPYAANYYSYEFGENYTHIVDTTNKTERWLSIGADGQLWAFKQVSGVNDDEDGDGSIVVGELEREPEESYFRGQLIPLSWTALDPVFGSEEMLNYLYQKALITRENAEKAGLDPKECGFSETYSRLGYSFTFATMSGRSTAEVPQLARITVKFTLSEEYTLETLEITSNILINYIEYNSDLEIVEEESYINWEMDEYGKITINNENGDQLIDYVKITQKTKKQVPEEPRNPYAQEDMFFTNFDVKNSNGETIGDEEIITIDANKVYNYAIDNIQPSTANLTFDPINVYLIRANGSEVQLGYDTLKTVGINSYVSSSGFTINSLVAGELKIKLQTANVTRYLNFNVLPGGPSRLYPWVYSYFDTGYVWEQHVDDATIKTVTVYVGQSFCFKAAPSQDEMNYVESGYTPYLFSGVADNCTIDSAVVQGETVSRFTASAAGTYRIRCQTAFTELPAIGIGCVIDVVVKDIPEMSTYLAGEYIATMQYPKPGRVSVEIEVTGEGTAVATIVNMEGNTETLNLTFSQTADSATVASVHASGANLGYSISLNEAYKLVLSYPTGFGSAVENVVLNILE